VLGMREPVALSAVYTGVKLLDARDVLQYEASALEDAFRQNRFGGYSSRSRRDEKYSGLSIANKNQYLMVLGGPGAGKSTFLRKVGLEALRTFYYEGAEYGHRLIPVLLELKRFEANKIDIAKLIAAEFETCGFPEADTFAQNALAQGNLLVLLDGLDEVPSANLNNVLSTIRDFVDRYDDNRFIASCRVAASGYRDDAFRRFSDVTMADFDDEQIEQFISNWFGSEQDKERNTAGKCWAVLQKPENKASKELAHTPLLLTYLCLVYNLSQRFPNNRSALYKKALRILLEEWAAEKRILRDEIYEGLSIEQEEILLSEIAYKGMVDDQLFFTQRELSAQIKVFLSSNLNAPKHLDSEAVLNAVEVQQGILVERAEDTYSFSHLTLQEYLTAQHLIDNHEWPQLVQQHLTDNRWREIFLLLPGLMRGKSNADDFLVNMENQARTYLSTQKLRNLANWVTIHTHSLELSKLLRKRIIGVLLILSLDLPRTLRFENSAHPIPSRRTRILSDILTQILTFAHYIDIPISINIHSVQNRSWRTDFLKGLANLCLKYGFIQKTAYDKIISKLPKMNELSVEGTENFYIFWLSLMGMEKDVSTLDVEELVSLSNYFYAWQLIVQCKESATMVSSDVWKGIESRIFIVPTTSETNSNV